MTLDNITIESPLSVLDIGSFILPYLDKIFFGVFSVAAVFVAVTAAMFLYHWWRYADNVFFSTITVGSYAFGSLVLLGAMRSVI